jgi:homoserine kinase
VAGLTSGEPALLAATMGDELHEGPRNQHRPEVAKLIDVARGAGALHACWSGAGPSVLALVLEDSAPTVVEALSLEVYPGIVRRFQVATIGLI